MQHAAVVPGLVPADAILFFQHDDSGAGKPLAQPVRSRQAHDAAADNDYSLRVHFFECSPAAAMPMAATARSAPMPPP